MKKLIKFLKGFLFLNSILALVFLWLSFSCLIFIKIMIHDSFIVSEFTFIFRLVGGLLFVFGIPIGVSFGLHCAKYK